MKRLIVASNNADKIKEIKQVLDGCGYEVISVSEAGINIEVEETGSTFEENALLKAKAVHDITGEETIADDSGICVDFLDGAPGIYSARFAGEQADDEQRNSLLLEKLAGVETARRGAHYECVIAYIDSDGTINTFSGTCCGKIGTERKGTNGFGYDPLFVIDDATGTTMAQISAEEKHKISHRGRALREFGNFISKKKKMLTGI